ncbi:family 20 glycosylhydrolase [Actinoalloteichus fjordicus]|uniref:family 20 glycosylhydrolase n=1 Tax=Actinoalloteichus TaxID=65496 RepID=UPI0009524B59
MPGARRVSRVHGSWWSGPGAARRRADSPPRRAFDVVLCPEMRWYLDQRQSTDEREPIPERWVHTLADVYRYEPLPAGLPMADAVRILGAPARIWSEMSGRSASSRLRGVPEPGRSGRGGVERSGPGRAGVPDAAGTRSAAEPGRRGRGAATAGRTAFAADSPCDRGSAAGAHLGGGPRLRQRGGPHQ